MTYFWGIVAYTCLGFLIAEYARRVIEGRWKYTITNKSYVVFLLFWPIALLYGLACFVHGMIHGAGKH